MNANPMKVHYGIGYPTNNLQTSSYLPGIYLRWNLLTMVWSRCTASTSPEPLGTVVIECLAMGRPLIGPNHGGAAEIMEHNKTGLLFTPKNELSLAEQIETYYNDSELRSILGQKAQVHALNTFAISTHTNKIEAVYEKLLQ